MPGQLRSVLMSQLIALFYSDFSTIRGRRQLLDAMSRVVLSRTEGGDARAKLRGFWPSTPTRQRGLKYFQMPGNKCLMAKKPSSAKLAPDATHRLSR
jgi:hypothetical protein